MAVRSAVRWLLSAVRPRNAAQLTRPADTRGAAAGVVEVHQQVPSELGQPGAARVSGDSKDVHPAGGVLDDEERIQPAGDRLQMQQVAGQDRVRLGPQELAP